MRSRNHRTDGPVKGFRDYSKVSGPMAAVSVAGELGRNAITRHMSSFPERLQPNIGKSSSPREPAIYRFIARSNTASIT
jgi:hypothetical protein